jgi:hypothetical protein
MNTEHQPTPEEKAYGRFLEEKRDVLSGAARTLLSKAQSAAYADHLISSYCFQPAEYEEAMEKMRLAAAEITGEDRKLLARLWRLALAAAASIDPDDESHAGHKVTSENLHWYYRTVSDMVEEILDEKKIAELREKREELKLEDLDDIPF